MVHWQKKRLQKCVLLLSTDVLKTENLVDLKMVMKAFSPHFKYSLHIAKYMKTFLHSFYFLTIEKLKG